MRRIAGLSVALLVAIMLTGVSSASMTSSASINSYGAIAPANEVLLPLHVSGQWIVTPNGTRIQLRGAATIYNEYCGPNSYNSTAEAIFIQWLKSTGCDCVRLSFEFPDPDWNPVTWNGEWNLTEGPVMWYNSTVMSEVVNQYAQSGIYCILADFNAHQPGSVTNFTEAAEEGELGILPWFNQTWISDWVNVSSTFKNNPDVAMYELFNEPYGNSGNMTLLYLECIDAIRANGDNHICFCNAVAFSNSSQIQGVSNFAIDYKSESPIAGFNGGFLAGDTSGASVTNWFPGLSSNYTQQCIAAEVYASTYVFNALLTRQVMQCPVLLGELEVYNYSMSSPDAYFNQLCISLCEQYGISWNSWWLYGWLVDQYGTGGTTYWTTFVSTKLGGAFTSNYMSSDVAWNQTMPSEYVNALYQGLKYQIFPSFPALPFNIWSHINTNASSFWGIDYDVAYIDWSQSVTSVTFYGPCELLIQDWSSGAPWWGTVANYRNITLSSGQTTTVTVGNYSVVSVYPWANSITYLPLPNG